MDLTPVLVESLRSIAVVLIIIGVLIAFLWKAAFYMNLSLGLVITTIVTYLVNAAAEEMSLTVTIFFVGVILSAIVAAMGGFLCLVEGFTLSSIGFWAYLISGNPSSFFSSDIIVESAIAGALSTGIGGFLGDRAFSFGIFHSKWSRPKRTSTEIGTSTESGEKPIEVEFIEIDEATKKKIYGYILLHKKFELETVAQRFGLEKTEVENFLLELVADKKIKGTIDPKTGTFTLEQETQ